ncbi:MAG: tetratricopeptide repeat protein [Microcoleaceae cyanobacterium]
MDQQDFYNQGLEKMRQQDYQGAISALNQAITINPYEAEAYYQRGLAYFDLGQIHEAVFNYTRAIEINSENTLTYYSRALARLKLKNLPGALEDIDRTIQLNSKYASAYQLRGIIYRKQGEITRAVTNFKQAAKLYLEQQNKAGCRRCLELIKPLQSQQNIVAQSSPSPQPIQMISEADFYQQLIEKAEQGDCSAALREIEWILQVDSQDGNAYCCRGIIHYKLENYRQAMTDLNQALKYNPGDVLAYRNRGKVRSKLGDHLGAIADFNQALQSQPNDIMLYIARGNAYQFAGNYSDAIQDYTQAIELNPNDGNPYYQRGLAYACLEEMKLAVTDYQHATRLFCEQENWDKYQTVLNHLRRLQKSVPQTHSSQVSDVLRQRLLRLVGGHWAIAQRLIEQAEFNYPGMPEEWYIEKVIYDIERNQ